MRRDRGITLIEIVVVIGIIGTLLAMTIPAIGNAISTSRSRTVVARFTQDFAAVRSNAAAVAGSVFVLVLNGDCSWSTTVDGTADSTHSISTAAVASMGPGTTCTGSGGTTFPVTFTFTSQGFVSTSASVTFGASSGETWPVSVLGSGSVMNTKIAS